MESGRFGLWHSGVLAVNRQDTTSLSIRLTVAFFLNSNSSIKFKLKNEALTAFRDQYHGLNLNLILELELKNTPPANKKRRASESLARLTVGVIEIYM